MKSISFDVFVSYSHDDQDYADALLRALSESGLVVWNDESLMAGSDWAIEIESALAKAKFMVLLVSPSSLQSQWVNYELGYAIAAKKPVISVLIRDVSDIPTHLARIQYIDARDLSPYATAKRLVEAVKASEGKKNGS
jgi:hypothetical protein